MAFVGIPIVAPQGVAQTRACASQPTAKVSRRGALRLAASVAVGVAAAAVSSNGAGMDAYALRDLKEIKKDVEKIKYEESILDVGPDPEEKLIVREKKKKPENPAIAAQNQFEKKELAQYEAMLAREREEAERVKSLFAKKK